MKSIFIILFLIFSACDENPVDSSGNLPSNPISFSLQDLNTSSGTYNDFIGPDTWDGEIRLFYFSDDETWDICVSRFDSLNSLYIYYHQQTSTDIYVIGIGRDDSTPVSEITASNNRPWVKENSEYNVWSTWNASNRDLYIMDRDGEIIDKINLTSSFPQNQIKSVIDGL